MKTKYISSLLIVFLLFVSACKKELVPQDSSSTSIPVTTEATPVLPPETTKDVVQSLPQTQQNTALTTQATKTLAGMNPPHGQTGHRCDIAVGAPLNSPSNKAASATTVTNPVPSSQTPVILKQDATTTVTQPGMNPPHGKEGHRCEIAVGAPLPKD